MAATDHEGASPRPLVELTMALVVSKVLAAAMEAGIFDAFARGPATVREIAQVKEFAERPTEILLTACASLGLLRKDGDRFQNSPLAGEYLVRGRPRYFGSFIEMFDRRTYPGCMRLIEAVQKDRPVTWDSDRYRSLFDTEDPELLAGFWDAMYSLSSFTAGRLAQAWDFGRMSRLLDVGGGGGGYAIGLCLRNPRLRVTIFDLPQAGDISMQRVAQAGLRDRIDYVSGDFFIEERLPQGYDGVLLSLVLHDWAEGEGRQILGKCYEALEPGGTVLVNELVLDDDGGGPPEATLMSVLMLVETRAGRAYSGAEYGDWLQDAGFEAVEVLRYAGVGTNAVITARKPISEAPSGGGDRGESAQ